MEKIPEELLAMIQGERQRRAASGKKLSPWPAEVRDRLVALVKPGKSPCPIALAAGIAPSLLHEWVRRSKATMGGKFRRVSLGKDAALLKKSSNSSPIPATLILRGHGYEVEGLSILQLTEFFANV